MVRGRKVRKQGVKKSFVEVTHMDVLKNEPSQVDWKGGAGSVFVLVSLAHFYFVGQMMA